MATSIRIIANRKVNLTDDEWSLYLQICASYDNPPSVKGADLFHDLFESDDNGIIVFLRPPSTRYTSMEVFLFVASLMMQQQIRLMWDKTNSICDALTRNTKGPILEMSKRLDHLEAELKKVSVNEDQSNRTGDSR